MNPVNYLGQKITDSPHEIALTVTITLGHLQFVILYDLRFPFHNNSPFLRVKGVLGDKLQALRETTGPFPLRLTFENQVVEE